MAPSSQRQSRRPLPRQPQGQGFVAFLPVGRKTLKAAKPKPYPSVPITLGDHLKRRRIELGLLQRELAKQLGVGEWALRHWERNTTAPAIRFVSRIIAFLGYDPYPVPKSLPDRLRAARRRQGISRRELARRLGLDEETLARWERGTRQPRGKYLTLVERFLGDLRSGGCVLRIDRSSHAADGRREANPELAATSPSR